MSLSSRVINKIVDTINVSFAALGNANGMRMPKSEDNRAAFAWDYFVAKHVLRLAEKRKDAAEEAAVKAGVLPDKERNPLPPGTRAITYNDGNVQMMVEVRSSSGRVNVDALLEYLFTKGGVKRDLLDKAVAASSKQTKPAHVFTPMLVSE